MSWYAIQPRWSVLGDGGATIGEVESVLADEELDIFSGLVVHLPGDGSVQVEASAVASIAPGEVRLLPGTDHLLPRRERDERNR